MLSDEDKRRIEEEERYRAEVRSKLEPSPEPARAEPEPAKPKKKGVGGCGMLIALFFGLFVLMAVIASVSNSSRGGSSTGASSRPVITLKSGRTLDAIEAQILCEGKVKDQLVSPGSAKFAGRSSSEWSDPVRSGNTWRHTVVVDSQNALGGLLRSRWLCILDGTADTITVTQQ